MQLQCTLRDAEKGFKHAKDHSKQRLLVQDAAGEGENLAYRAMAYTQLAVRCRSHVGGS
jgi:hypothetical protein